MAHHHPSSIPIYFLKAFLQTRHNKPHQRLPLHITVLEGEELVAVVVVLIFAGGQLDGQLGGQLGEGVQNSDDFGLDF